MNPILEMETELEELREFLLLYVKIYMKPSHTYPTAMQEAEVMERAITLTGDYELDRKGE